MFKKLFQFETFLLYLINNKNKCTMSSSRNLNIYHKTRLKNCKGFIVGDTTTLKENDFVHWCPTKKWWLTDKTLVIHKIVDDNSIKNL